MNMTIQKLTIALLLILCLVTGLIVFWQGLTGPFLFDDFPILERLSLHGGIDSFQNLLSFAFSYSYTGSLLGRPLSMLSFALNDQYWPADPWPFKYTNLMLHLLNSLLVFILARQLTRLIVTDWFNIQLTALATMAVWLLHPMHLSTMMLVVQRMTELMAMFTLCGLICFMHGRILVLQYPMRGYFWMSAGIGLGGTLGFLCKENGILLPLYALVLEVTLIHAAGYKKPLYWKFWVGFFLFLPCIALFLYFLTGDRIESGYIIREFTLNQRLLTEARILVDYLLHILIPRLSGSGLFHDDYIISTGFLDPITTLLSIAFLSILTVIAFVKRKQYPVLAFAILWFLAGHVLESTFISLELYFEHRNYLPMLGPLFALTYYLLSVIGVLKRFAIIGLFAFISLQIFLSYQSSVIWGNKALLATVWSEENPTSQRAQQLAADYWEEQGDHTKAQQHLLTAVKNDPREITSYAQILLIGCHNNTLNRSDIEWIIKHFPDGKFSWATIEIIRRLGMYINQHTCPILSYSDLDKLIELLLDNRRYYSIAEARYQLLFQRGKIAAERGMLNLAIESMDKAYQIKSVIDIPVLQAIWLSSAELYDEALSYIKLAKSTKIPWYQNQLSEDINKIEAFIRQQKQEKQL